MTASVVTFGEVMLRLKSPSAERLLQSPHLEATFGGGEANVAASLANFGIPVEFVTALPANAIGDACLAALRGLGIGTRHVLRSGDRLGVYYLEGGSNQRPSRVIYDRAGSSFAETDPQQFDWPRIFDGVGPVRLELIGLTKHRFEGFGAVFHEDRKTFAAKGDNGGHHLNLRRFSQTSKNEFDLIGSQGRRRRE